MPSLVSLPSGAKRDTSIFSFIIKDFNRDKNVLSISGKSNSGSSSILQSCFVFLIVIVS